jgi:signal transduction histidine kinase
LKFVSRTKEAVIIDDASAKTPFAGDEYLVRTRARSVLCLPLVKQATLTGVLYLENTMAAHAFTADKVAVLKLLASQAAVSVENARLYTDLRQTEAYLAEAQGVSRTGSFGWCPATGEIYWSKETFRIFEVDPAMTPTLELMVARVHPDDRSVVQHVVDRASRDGQDFNVDYRLLMPDGSINYVHVLVHAVRDGSTGALKFVGAVTDVTATKRAEEALHKAQAELAHVTRVATLGELTGSIAHEINQPLGAVVNNASACVRWLAAQNLEEARQSAVRVIADGHRASEIIGRIRALAKKAPPRKDWLDINDTIREVIVLAQSEVQGNRVSLRTHLAGGVPRVWGDRIQVQQVMLNLMMNAIEAMSGVGQGPRELEVRTDRGESTEVVIGVGDSGPGLEATSLDRLFDAFYTTKPDGLGMGLAISRSIVESHGGRLWATANAPHGAVFRFTLPIGSEGEG